MEDETHVLSSCPFYDYFRGSLFIVTKSFTIDLIDFNNEDSIMFLFSNENTIRICAQNCVLFYVYVLTFNNMR